MVVRDGAVGILFGEHKRPNTVKKGLAAVFGASGVEVMRSDRDLTLLAPMVLRADAETDH